MGHSSDVKFILEQRLFQIGSITVVVLGLALFILDFFIQKDVAATYIEGVGIIIFSFFVYQSYKDEYHKYRYPFLLMILLSMDATYFHQQGWTVICIMINLLGIVYLSILVGSNDQKYLILIFIANFILINVIDYLFLPGSNTAYYEQSLEVTQRTHIIYGSFALLGTAILVRYFKINYDKDQNLILERNNELIEAREDLEKQNYRLKVIRNEILNKQEKLNEQSQSLQERNDKIKGLNDSLAVEVEKRTLELNKINDELNLLFYRSSHDFKRPLTTMLGLTNIAKLSELDSFTHNLMVLVAKTSEAMSRMLDKYIVLYQVNDLSIYPAYTFNDLKRHISQYTAEQNVDFVCEIEIDQYKSDDRRNYMLYVIMQQLVENSCMFRNHTDDDKIRVRLFEEEGFLKVKIWDNGQGIPEEAISKVFNLYYRGNTNSKGCGLGLYVAKTALNKLNGDIEVSSKENEFTEFNLSFKI